MNNLFQSAIFLFVLIGLTSYKNEPRKSTYEPIFQSLEK